MLVAVVLRYHQQEVRDGQEIHVYIGVLAVAVAYHLGAAKAESTAEGPFVSLVSEWQWGYMLTMTGQGEIYFSTEYGGPFPEWHYWGTIQTGGTATEPTTWGQIEAEFGEECVAGLTASIHQK